MRPLLSLLVLLTALPAAAQGSPPPKSEKTARVLVQEAEAALASGDWDKALAVVTKALEIAPEDPGALEIGGSLTAASGGFDEADRMLARACGLRPERPECFVRLGDAKAERAKFCAGRRDDACVADASGAALSAYREALRLSPDSLGAKRGIAIALLTAGHIEESIAAHEAWISASPNDPVGGFSLAKLFAESERWGDVAKLADRFTEHHAETAGAVGLRALGLMYEGGRREEGDALLGRLRAIDPSKVRQIGLKAIDDAIRGRPERARNGLWRYLAADPPPDEAEVVYNEVLERDPRIERTGVDPPRSAIREDPSMHPGIVLPRVIRKKAPVYPPLMLKRGIEGHVVVEAVVRADGTIGRLRLEFTTHSEFAVPALDAVKQWRYEPATEDGKPVAIYYMILVDFRLR